MKRRVDIQSLRHPLVPLRRAARIDEPAMIWRRREHVTTVVQRAPELLSLGGGPRPVFAQEGNSLIVEHYPTLLMRLRVLFEPPSVLVLADRALYVDDAAAKVEVVPMERAQLATSRTCRHGGPDESPPGRSARERFVHKASGRLR